MRDTVAMEQLAVSATSPVALLTMISLTAVKSLKVVVALYQRELAIENMELNATVCKTNTLIIT